VRWTTAHRAGVWRYLRVLGCTVDEADELCQETFVRLLARPFEPRSEGATWSYLQQAARWEFLRCRKRRGRAPEVEWTEAVDRAYGAWAERDGGSQWLEALRECVEALPPRSRRAVHLSYVEQRSRGEIARELGLKENGVKTLLQRARQTIGQCVQRRLATESER